MSAAAPIVKRGEERGGSQTLRAEMAIRDLVLSGEVKPGERLAEVQLGERIGASRTPVRAALMLLADEGLIEPLAGGGYAVRAFSDRDVADAIELRGTLEGLAARLAAERGVAPDAEAELRNLLARLDGAVSAVQRSDASFGHYVELNAAFHRRLVGLAESGVLERQIERAMMLPFASPSAFVEAQSQIPEARQILLVAQDQHRAVVDAILRREGARAEALMREHARLAVRNLDLAMTSKRVMALVPGAALILAERSR